jgi:hypothetical protein
MTTNRNTSLLAMKMIPDEQNKMLVMAKYIHYSEELILLRPGGDEILAKKSASI